MRGHLTRTLVIRNATFCVGKVKNLIVLDDGKVKVVVGVDDHLAEEEDVDSRYRRRENPCRKKEDTGQA
nr:hypothetical protein BaRGS_005242 [Batillaria attramentaria]